MTPLSIGLMAMRDHLKDEMAFLQDFIEASEYNGDRREQEWFQAKYDETHNLLLQVNELIEHYT